MNRYEFLNCIDEKKALLDGTADYIWENPELAFTEFKSAARLCEVLRAEDFEVETGLAGIETAFSGRFGSGKPVIGILGEFDALSGLGQEAGATEAKLNGAPGHGCGHNLLGVGSLAAALGVKRWLEEHPGKGTVIYFGCPAEEGGSGKGFMARDGVFDALDAAFCWHPDAITWARTSKSLANIQAKFIFDGLASHAGAQPELGRSALDAVELMNVGVNFLREHMIDDARVHYAITDAGGVSPNVVQPHAEVLYLIRAPRNDQAKELYERVCRIAQGAALMTDTKEHHVFIKACSNTIVCETMTHMLQELLEQLPPPAPTEQDWAFAKEMTEKALNTYPKADLAHPLHWEVEPYHPTVQKHGSTDVGDVSWVCPTAQIGAATLAYGTPGHSWQTTAQGKLAYAHEMTRYAGKILAAGAVKLLEHPELLEAAKAEHRGLVGPEGYIPPIPPEVRPSVLK